MIMIILVWDCWRFVVVVVVFSLQSTENTTNVSKYHYMYEPFQTKINANYVLDTILRFRLTIKLIIAHPINHLV